MRNEPLEKGIKTTLEPDKIVTVVIAAYNEEQTVQRLIDKVLAQDCVNQLVIVDDASTDSTWKIIESCAMRDTRITPLRHDANRGKGAAIKNAMAKASSKIVIVQDADLEYDPSEYQSLILPIVQGHADVVYGSRFQGAGAHRVLYYWHYLGNRFLTLMSNMLTNLNLTDMETCYKAMTLDIMKRLDLQEDRFGMEPEITAKIAKMNARVYEVPISYYGRTYAEGKKINWRDGVRAIWCIMKYNLVN